MGDKSLDLVMSDDQRWRYTFDRKMFPDVTSSLGQLNSLRQVIIHSAITEAELQSDLDIFSPRAERYFPKKSSEPHYFDSKNGVMHVINTRGVTRLRRDLDLVEVLKDHSVHNITTTLRHFRNDPLLAAERFRSFASSKVSEVADSLKVQGLDKLVASKGKVSVVFGPKKSLPSTVCFAEQFVNDEYLACNVARVGDSATIFFDYIFADQAVHILGKLFSYLDARYSKVDVDIFHYGKVGAISDSAELGQVAVPNAYVTETDLHNYLPGAQKRFHPIYSLFSNPVFMSSFKGQVGERVLVGPTMNSVSVLNQQKSTLETANGLDVLSVDMEWAGMASVIQAFETAYPNIGKVNLAFAGSFSDHPRKGQTLAETPYSSDFEKPIARAFLDYIASQ